MGKKNFLLEAVIPSAGIASSSKGKDFLFGKKETTGGFTARTAEQEELDKIALEQARQSQDLRTAGVERLKEETGEGAARAQIEREVAAGERATQDTQRRLRDVVAQRGLGRSSAGLGQEISLGQQQAQRAARTRASLPERQQSLTNRLLSAGGAQQQFRGQQWMGPVTTKRGGGAIAPLMAVGGSVAGGIFGGPAGAQAGGTAGAGLGQGLQAGFGG